MEHCRKVIGEQVITLQMAQQLKTENNNTAQVHLFCRHCKAKFLIETETHCIDEEGKFHFDIDTDNDFTECQTPRKNPNQLAFHLSVFTQYLSTPE